MEEESFESISKKFYNKTNLVMSIATILWDIIKMALQSESPYAVDLFTVFFFFYKYMHDEKYG